MRRLGAILFAVGMAIASCKPKDGGSCSGEGSVVCADARTQLVCYAGKYASVACKGPAGCEGKDAHCDLSANEKGDACSSKDEGRRFCSADHKTLLRCTNRAITVAQTCPGFAGCTPNPVTKDFDCDQGEPIEGTPCTDNPDQCGRDGSRMFTCERGKWAATFACRGPKKCPIGGLCDRTIAADGDACTREEETRTTCGLERRSILQCKNGKLSTTTTCPAGKSCVGDDARKVDLWSSLLSVNARCE